MILRDLQDTEVPNLHFLEGTTWPVVGRGNHQSSPGSIKRDRLQKATNVSLNKVKGYCNMKASYLVKGLIFC